MKNQYGKPAKPVDFIEKETIWRRLSDDEEFSCKGIELPIGADYEDIDTEAIFTWDGTNAYRRSGYDGADPDQEG